MCFPERQRKLAYALMAHNAVMTTTVFNISHLVILLSTPTNLIQGKDDLFPGEC